MDELPRRSGKIATAHFKRITWRCIHLIDRVPSGLGAEVASLGLRLSQGSLQDVRNEGELLSRLASVLQFPPYFGRNWDAVNDCLIEQEADGVSGFVLVLENASNLLHRDPPLIGELLRSWLYAAEWWSKHNRSFHLVLVAEALAEPH